MSSRRKNPNEGPTDALQVTALVPDPKFARDWWAERQPQVGSPSVVPWCSPDLIVVWSQLRGDWSCVVVMPSEPDDSTAGLGRALSEVGARLSVYPIEFIEANGLDLDSSTRLIARVGTSADAAGRRAPTNGSSFASSTWAPPITRTIVALESPLANPLSVPIAYAADGVVLCVRRGRDRIASVRDTIQIVGADRILCCVLIQ
ncbi:MAG TPA: hypothetical protein VF976_07290 [Gemmatimonadales bacterium]